MIREVPVVGASSPVVLLVDDREDTMATYAIGLAAMGFHPVTVTTLQNAFDRACTCHPRVIVADLVMLMMSGFDLIYRVRGDIRLQETPIIVLTGLTLASIRQHAREAGCNRFLLKPCSLDALATEIRDVFLTAQEAAFQSGHWLV
jgi:two-component system cell cycle response regulator DivK